MIIPEEQIGRIELTFAPGGDAPVLLIGGTPAKSMGLRQLRDVVVVAIDPYKSKVFYRLQFPGAILRGVTSSDDGRHVLIYGISAEDDAGSPSGQRPLFAVIDPRSGKQLAQFGGVGGFAPQCATIAGDGSRVLSFVNSNTLELWDVSTGRIVRTFEPGRQIGALALSRDGTYSLQGGMRTDENVELFDLTMNEVKAVMRGHLGPVTSVAFSPDEKRALSTSLDGSVRLWDLATGEELLAFTQANRVVLGGIFHPDGRHIATVDAPSGPPSPSMPPSPPRPVIRYWDIASGAQLAEWMGPMSPFVGLSFSNQQKHVVVAGAGGTLAAYPVPVGATTLPASGPSTRPNAATRDGAQLHSFESPLPLCLRFVDSRTLLAGTERNVLQRFDAGNGLSLGAQKPAALQQWPELRALSSDGKHAVSCSLGHVGRELWLWETEGGLTIHKVRTAGDIRAIDITDDGAYVAVASIKPELGGVDLSIVGRVQKAEVAGLIAKGSPERLCFAPDSSTLAIMSSAASGMAMPTGVQLWNLKSGELRELGVGGLGAAGLSYAADSNQLACAFVDGVTIYDIAQAKVLRSWPVLGRLECVATSVDGRYVLTGGNDSNVRLFDAQTGRQLAFFQEHRAVVTAVAFSPDGSLAASAGADNTVRVWRLPR